jgi:hypothetical protein
MKMMVVASFYGGITCFLNWMKCFSSYMCKHSVFCHENRNGNGINLHFRLVLSFLASLSLFSTYLLGCDYVFEQIPETRVCGYRIKTSRISDSAAYITKASWTLATLHFVLRVCVSFLVGFNMWLWFGRNPSEVDYVICTVFIHSSHWVVEYGMSFLKNSESCCWWKKVANSLFHLKVWLDSVSNESLIQWPKVVTGETFV